MCTFFTLCSILLIAANSACPGIGPLFGAADVSRITGNGGLTVGVNRYGQIRVCRWPSPGYFNQVRYTACSGPSQGGQSAEGVMWGVRVGGKLFWMRGAPWQGIQRYVDTEFNVIETVAALPGREGTVREELFVHPRRDVLVARLVVQDFQQAPGVYWFANFSPCTRLVPEMPIADWALDAWNDFAAFAVEDGKRVYHFRPRQPASRDWERVRELASASRAEAADWSSFEDGVWIGYATPNAVAGFSCGRDGEEMSGLTQANRGSLESVPAAVGSCHSVIELVPGEQEGGLTATVFVAFGKNRGEIDEALGYASDQGSESLLEETREYWTAWLSQAVLPDAREPELMNSCRRDLVTLAQSTDRESGAVVRCGSEWGMAALDWVREGAWPTLAYDLAGYHDRAEAHTLFYAEAVRHEGRRGQPHGSLPGACYANGVEGIPHVVVDGAAAAWMLGSCWRHATFLEGPARERYLSRVWERIAPSADFLTEWADGRTREPQYAFDYQVCRDTQSTELLLATYMGVDSALRMAAVLGRAATADWARRKRQLDALIRFHCVDENGQWKVEEVLPFWRAEMLQAKLPSWDATVARQLSQMKTPHGVEALEAVCDAALVWEGRVEKLASLRALLKTASSASPDGGENFLFSDSLYAAEHFVAASLIYSSHR